MDEVDAPLVDGRGEAGEIAHHPAAEGDEQVPPVQFQGQQPVAEIGQALETLGALAGRDDDHLGVDTRRLQGPDQARAMQIEDRLVHDHGGQGTAQERGQPRGGGVDEAGTDDHFIGPPGQGHGNHAHQRASPGVTAAARTLRPWMMASTAT
jgi:hypothetical protein